MPAIAHLTQEFARGVPALPAVDINVPNLQARSFDVSDLATSLEARSLDDVPVYYLADRSLSDEDVEAALLQARDLYDIPLVTREAGSKRKPKSESEAERKKEKAEAKAEKKKKKQEGKEARIANKKQHEKEKERKKQTKAQHRARALGEEADLEARDGPAPHPHHAHHAHHAGKHGPRSFDDEELNTLAERDFDFEQLLVGRDLFNPAAEAEEGLFERDTEDLEARGKHGKKKHHKHGKNGKKHHKRSFDDSEGSIDDLVRRATDAYEVLLNARTVTGHQQPAGGAGAKTTGAASPASGAKGASVPGTAAHVTGAGAGAGGASGDMIIFLPTFLHAGAGAGSNPVAAAAAAAASGASTQTHAHAAAAAAAAHTPATGKASHTAHVARSLYEDEETGFPKMLAVRSDLEDGTIVQLPRGFFDDLVEDEE